MSLEEKEVGNHCLGENSDQNVGVLRVLLEVVGTDCLVENSVQNVGVSLEEVAGTDCLVENSD